MRLHDGRYECANCGAQLDIPTRGEPKVTFHATGGKPNVRVLKLEGREIHRCEVRKEHGPQVGVSRR
jgi:hypothetical protein